MLFLVGGVGGTFSWWIRENVMDFYIMSMCIFVSIKFSMIHFICLNTFSQ